MILLRRQAKEEAMMSRIRNAETAQTFAEMTQRIAELEIQVHNVYKLEDNLSLFISNDLSCH
jgi:hypothetical protein